MTRRNLVPVLIFRSVFHRFTTSLSTRKLCSNNHLKNITKPEKIPVEYWNNILLVARDLKKNLQENSKKCLNLLNTKHVTLLFVKPHGRFQLAFTLACDLLGARRTLYQDSNFENQPNPGDSGSAKEISRVLSRLTDMFIIHGLHHDVLNKIVSTATVPVFSASSNLHCLQKALSDMMTFQERHERLKGLTLAWIGPPNSLFNSYTVLCSKFEINLQYTLICSFGAGRMSPARLQKFNFQTEETDSLRTEFKDVIETVNGAHVVATSMHPDESSKITLDLLKNASSECVFMHSLPRSWKEVSDDVFNNEINLSWKTSENYLYIGMAFVLTSLTEYEPRQSASSP